MNATLWLIAGLAALALLVAVERAIWRRRGHRPLSRSQPRRDDATIGLGMDPNGRPSARNAPPKGLGLMFGRQDDYLPRFRKDRYGEDR